MRLNQIMRQFFNFTTMETTVGYSRDPLSKNNLYIHPTRLVSVLESTGASITAPGDILSLSFLLPFDYNVSLTALLQYSSFATVDNMHILINIFYAIPSAGGSFVLISATDKALGSVAIYHAYNCDITALITTLQAGYLYQINISYSATVNPSNLAITGLFLSYFPTR